MLPQSTSILSDLNRRFPFTKFSLIADSAFSDCCVDFVSAAHMEADAIIKVGDTCIHDTTGDCATYCVPCFSKYGIDALVAEILCVKDRAYGTDICLVSSSRTYGDHVLDKVPGACLMLFEEFCRNPTSGLVFGIGIPRWKINLVALVAPDASIYGWLDMEMIPIPVARLKSKRFALLSSVSENCPIGLIIHSTSKMFAELAFAISKILVGRGYPVYIFSVGGISPTKLGNFPDIRIWTVLGCPRHCFSDEQYFATLISPFELLCAIGALNFWQDKYLLEAPDLVKALDSLNFDNDPIYHASQDLTNASDFSALALSTKEFRGVPLGIFEEVAEGPVRILKGSVGIPRDYRNVE
jgi:hypothetical protein